MNGKRPIITLKGRGRVLKPVPGPGGTGQKATTPSPAKTAKPPQKPAKPRKAPPAPKPRGMAYIPPRKPVEAMAVCWLVYRDSGKRPRARHSTPEAAHTEAQRIAQDCPGASVWVLKCYTVATYTEAPALVREACPDCEGSGDAPRLGDPDTPCPRCEGRGWVPMGSSARAAPSVEEGGNQ